MKKIVIFSLAAIFTMALIGCETTSNTNVKVNGTKVNENTAVVLNTNSSVNMVNTNMNKVMTREEFDKDKAKYEAEAKDNKGTYGTGANDLWLWTKTRAALTTTNDLRDSTINVDVTNDVITLKGTVATAAEKAKAEEVAKGIEGQKGVKNDLKVDAKDSMTNQATSSVTDGDGKANMNTNKK
ncbi:MAG: BON domain-containing protein [Pyrinomonadaceae bacterium]